MMDSKVTHVIRQDGLCFPSDPKYQRKWHENVDVTAYSETQRVERHHELSWQYLSDNSDVIESRLRIALWKECQKNFNEFMKEIELDDSDCEWESMQHIDWSDKSSLDRQVYLYGVTLLDSLENEIAHAVFTFDIGWDDEHGLCVIMHADKVLAVNGAGDFRF